MDEGKIWVSLPLFLTSMRSPSDDGDGTIRFRTRLDESFPTSWKVSKTDAKRVTGLCGHARGRKRGEEREREERVFLDFLFSNIFIIILNQI